ncbi:MAG: pyridoxamine 5'-phosphate oxidase family protein [Deltaproteobacteria bacterium]|nr:pyridoxamine 5'-phosphate oxidase family protein [Deltaproteobacteria bacterium]
MKKVVDFVKSCDVYFLATTELDQPRVRPFGTFFIYEGKIYFQTAKKKKVSKQLHTNPKIEICAYDGKGSFIRIQATAVEDERIEAKQYALDQFPELKSQYKADDGNTEVFYLKDATATLEAPKGQGWVETF